MFLLDSNILIGFLAGDEKIRAWIDEKQASEETLAFSVITRIELLSIPEADEQKLEIIERFLDAFCEVGLYGEIPDLAASIRRKQKITLGDAIVLGTAVRNEATLITNDKQLCKKAEGFVSTISLL